MEKRWGMIGAPEVTDYFKQQAQKDYSHDYNFKKFLASLPTPTNNKPVYVLDMGCGAGQYSKLLLALGYHVVAYDPSPDAKSCLKIPKEFARRFTFFNEGVETLKVRDFFHGVWCEFSLPYVTDLEKGIFNVMRALRPDGVLYMSFPLERLIPIKERGVVRMDDEKLKLLTHSTRKLTNTEITECYSLKVNNFESSLHAFFQKGREKGLSTGVPKL